MGKYFSTKNKLYNLVSMEDYNNNPELYNSHNTAILINDMVYPIKGQSESGVGIYYQPGSMCSYLVKPENPEDYSINNPNNRVMDFNSIDSIEQFMEQDKILKDIEEDVLLTNENIFHLKINPNDQPQMKALKNAINLKNVDKKNYERRFPQFNNDMRLLKEGKITLNKLISTCNAFDINVELTLSDKPGAPNPMGTTVVANLTDDGGDKNE